MDEWDVMWTCPKCSTVNFDNLEMTSQPYCEMCETDFFWDHIAPDDLRRFNFAVNKED